MYNAAICDDDGIFVSYMRRIVTQAAGSEFGELRISEFTQGEVFVSSLEGGAKYDLLILDMELGKMDGDQVAQIFRKKNRDAVLVFCSGVRAPSVKSFKATPFRYLLKTYTDEQIINEMQEILEEVKKRNYVRYIVGHYRSNMIKVDIRNIMYIENAKRGSRIVVRNDCAEADFEGQILVDAKLSSILKEYPEFVCVHSSYIVNINRIERITGNEVLLDNGERLSVSRPYQKELRLIFAQSIAAKY